MSSARLDTTLVASSPLPKGYSMATLPAHLELDGVIHRVITIIETRNPTYHVLDFGTIHSDSCLAADGALFPIGFTFIRCAYGKYILYHTEVGAYVGQHIEIANSRITRIGEAVKYNKMARLHKGISGGKSQVARNGITLVQRVIIGLAIQAGFDWTLCPPEVIREFLRYHPVPLVCTHEAHRIETEGAYPKNNIITRAKRARMEEDMELPSF